MLLLMRPIVAFKERNMQHKSNVKDEAKDRWEQILPSLGVDAEFLANIHGPCPACGGTDRFRFDDKDGYGSFFCNHCGAGDGISLVMRVNGWDFKQAAVEIRNVLGGAANDAHVAVAPVRKVKTEAEKKVELDRKKAQLRALWKSSRAVQHGDVVSKYFECRGIALKGIPSDLRTHLRLKYYEAMPRTPGQKKTEYTQLGTFPGMLALVRDPDGNATTLWRTYLDSEGKGKASVKQQKKPYSQPGAGSAVRLFEPVDGVLGVAEGIETALAAHILYKIPVWAGMCADIMKGIVFPDTVKEVVIFADNDAPDIKGFCKGIEAAKELAQRLRDEGRKVTIKMPKAVGTDYLDVLNAMQRQS